MAFHRWYSAQLEKIKHQFPILAITGARQVGKTTFLKEQFPDYEYYNLETPATLQQVKNDPLKFLQSKSHLIIDEIQKYPELFSYLQEIVDTRGEMDDFIISWSENLLLSEKISQSLAGRVCYLKMNGFSLSELANLNLLSNNLTEQMFKGFMPAIYDRNANPVVYYESYIATYLERDVKQISEVHNLSLFHKFCCLLAGRIGQLVNYTSLANDVGVDAKTIVNWISILEASFLIFQLHPYYENVGKRLIKASKIYFTDTGLVCRLLDIKTEKELENFYIYGNLFENMIIIDTLKQLNLQGNRENIYFYRDSNQKEVDLIIENSLTQIPIEIKSSSTYAQDFSKGIKYWNSLPHQKQQKNWVIIYTGNNFEMKEFNLINRRDYANFVP